MSSVSYVSNPRVTLNIIPRDQSSGLEDQRNLIVGQLAPAVAASGSIAFAVNPVADSTITLNGTAWTFKTSGATGAQTNIGASLSATLATLVTNLNASADAQVTKCTYFAGSDTLFIEFDTVGTSGNSFTLAASVATVSGSTLTGGAAAPGSAAAGLTRDIPRTKAEIGALFGNRSHVAMEARAYRDVNAVTNVDVIALADGAGTAATAAIAWSGTATEARTIFIAVVSATEHRYEIDVEISDTPADLTGKLKALVDDDDYAPFRCRVTGTDDGTITFIAANKGTVANSWLLSVLDELDRPAVSVPGIAATLTAWSGGATDPSLSAVFDAVSAIRYQSIVWPQAYTLSTLRNWIDARKNVDNNVMDGQGYVWRDDSFADVKALALATNSSEVVIFSNEPNTAAEWKGPHTAEAGDIITAKAVAAIARRREDGFSISDIVVTNEPLDQFGGIDKASLPLFNTPILRSGRPISGTGYTFEEQAELEAAGVTVIGYNRQNNAVILGGVVTTYLNDTAGNVDDTWHWLEWRHTHGAIREYMVLNCKREFSQYRMTSGQAVPGYAIASEATIRAYLYQLYDELANYALTVKGREHRRLFEDRLVVTLKPALRRVEIAADVPMVSQLGVIQGSVKFNFATA